MGKKNTSLENSLLKKAAINRPAEIKRTIFFVEVLTFIKGYATKNIMAVL
jgi:hypothetical protein